METEELPLPEILRRTRRSLGLSQEELADIAGLKRSMVADIEAGRRRIQPEAGTAVWNALINIKEERLNTIPKLMAFPNLMAMLPQESITSTMSEREELESLREEVSYLRKLEATCDELILAIEDYMKEQKADPKTAQIERLCEELDKARELHGQDLALIARLQKPGEGKV
jgi:transcriptional regulator with XRE-family HTH domain